MQRSTPSVYIFSDFRFHPEDGQLWRGQTRIRVHPQTAELLTILLDRAGQIVRREELRETLWPGEERVDHEKAINNAISRLRSALRDDPQNPRIIERVPKRGYRLLGQVEAIQKVEAIQREAPVTQIVDSGELPEMGLAVESHEFPIDAEYPVPSPQSLERPRRLPWTESVRRRSRLVAAVLASAAILIVISSLVWKHYQARTAQAPVSLGLAPFEADGQGTAAIAEGFRFDVAEALYRLPNVRLHAFHSMGSASGKDADDQAKGLGLDLVLLGRITRTGDQLFLTFQLLRERDSTYLATFRYSGSQDELSSIRDRLQKDLYHQLSLSGDTGSPAPGGTANSSAYDVYLRASYDFSQQTDEALRNAVGEYSRAITLDPNFAKAYTGLARTYLVMRSHGLMASDEAFEKAGSAVATALHLTPDLAEVHGLLGLILFYHDWKFGAGEEEERRAVQLDPNEALFHQWLALLLNHQGKYAEALHELDIASGDDPYWPPVLITDIFVSGNAHQWDRMLARAEKLKQTTGDSSLALDSMANALWYSKHYVEAIAQWREMASREGDTYRVRLEDAGLAAFRRDGVKGYALVRLAANHDPHYVPRHPNDFQDTEWRMWSGDRAAALQALRNLEERHDPEFLEVARTQVFDPIRNDPAYLDLLARAGLNQTLVSP